MLHFTKNHKQKNYLTGIAVLISTGITTDEKCGSTNQFKYTNKSEIINLSTLRSTRCPSWADYPHYTRGATGGFLSTNLIICGGSHDHSEECNIITPKTTKILTKMLFKRYDAASVIIREKYLWVSGGNDGTGTLSSTEFVEINTTAGPELPTALEGHEMIVVNDDLTLIIGGSSAGIEKSSTFYFKHKKVNAYEDQWFDGPSLQKERRNHAVGAVTDKVSLKKIVVATGGLDLEGALRSSEILREDSWSAG